MEIKDQVESQIRLNPCLLLILHNKTCMHCFTVKVEKSENFDDTVSTFLKGHFNKIHAVTRRPRDVCLLFASAYGRSKPL